VARAVTTVLMEAYKILVVVHTVIEDAIIRIISARKAARKESEQYRRFEK